jgi:hypothetical protein
MSSRATSNLPPFGLGPSHSGLNSFDDLKLPLAGELAQIEQLSFGC